MAAGPISPTTTRNALQSRFENGRGFTEKRCGEDKDMEFKVIDLSRLWLYRNGKSPKLDDVDMGIARMATI